MCTDKTPYKSLNSYNWMENSQLTNFSSLTVKGLNKKRDIHALHKLECLCRYSSISI